MKEAKTMSLTVKYNESFYDILLKYFVNLTEVLPNIFKLIAIAGFIVVISYMFYRVHGRYTFKNFEFLLIIGHLYSFIH